MSEREGAKGCEGARARESARDTDRESVKGLGFAGRTRGRGSLRVGAAEHRRSLPEVHVRQLRAREGEGERGIRRKRKLNVCERERDLERENECPPEMRRASQRLEPVTFEQDSCLFVLLTRTPGRDTCL